MNNIIKRFQKGYYRPISMPLWKMIIVYMIWSISLIGYILAVFSNLWFAILGVVFQFLGFTSMLIFDNGNWRKTEDGKKYLNEYGDIELK